MPFGQASGPPASHKQLQYLEALVRQAGHDGFRDARGPLGLTQRQAAGKFTRDVASALIDALVQDEAGAERAVAEPAHGGAVAGTADAADTEPSPLAHLPASALADELARRGWVVQPP